MSLMSSSAAWGVQHRDEEIQEHLALQVSKACVEELHRPGGTETLLLEGAESQGKAVTPQEPEPDIPVGLGWSWGGRHQLWLTGGRDSVKHSLA